MLPDQRPQASVVICTLDRAAYVRMAVESLQRQTVAADRFEILVVDNGSHDETPRVLDELATTTPNLRWVCERRPGLSHARNRGIAEARGDVIAFLDDDAIAAPSWLAAVLDAACADGVAAVGGRIRLRWVSFRPAWLPVELDSLYSAFDLGSEPRPLAYPEVPYGANMAFRRDVFADVGGFSTALGRQGGSLLSGEEKELFQRVAARGGRVVYAPDATVEHQVLPSRVSRRWLLRRTFNQGRSEILVQAITCGPDRLARRVARVGLHAARAAGALLAAGRAAVRGRGAPGVTFEVSRSVHWLGSSVQGMRSAHDLVIETPRPLDDPARS